MWVDERICRGDGRVRYSQPMTQVSYKPVPLDRPLGRRVLVCGRPGKTTLAKAIAQKHGLNLIEIDWIYHKPGWNERSDEEVRLIVQRRIAESENGWVYDGNGRNIVDMPLAQVDSVVLIQIPWVRTLWAYIKRGIRRSWTGEEIAGGNKETFRLNFASRESHLWHTFRTRRRDYRGWLEPQLPDGINYYLIESWKQLHQFYEIHQLPTQPTIDSREAASTWFE